MTKQQQRGLSVLIPVFNFDIFALVADLHEQLVALDIPFEIVCFDDGSESHFRENNQRIRSIEQERICYKALPNNLGRARIRNALAAQAKYSYLLFMDCDSKLVSPHYIQRYVQHLQEDTVLYGGRSYAATPPAAFKFYFHWYYGTQREVSGAAIRAKQPYHAFMTNNFLISKAIFEQIRFDERLLQYGHEDTLFGLELQKRQIKILHIDNPLEHIGLEETAIFLNKTRQGIQNLAWLAKQHTDLHTKLLQTWRKLKKWRLEGLTALLLKALRPVLLRNLHSRYPNLKIFDLYKLSLFIEAAKAVTREQN